MRVRCPSPRYNALIEIVPIGAKRRVIPQFYFLAWAHGGGAADPHSLAVAAAGEEAAVREYRFHPAAGGEAAAALPADAAPVARAARAPSAADRARVRAADAAQLAL